MRILVVDDEADFRNLLTEIISNLNYQIDTAADGITALEMVQKKDYDVALIDYMMPKMDGMYLMREIKKNDSETAVIFITGHGSIESAVDAMKQGAYDYITKPIQFEELESLLRRLFETRRLIAENRQLKKILHQNYNWPEDVINNLSVSIKNDKILPEDLPDFILETDDPENTAKSISLKPISVIEKETILRTLQHYDWDMNRSTKVLQISRSTLYRKIKKYHLRKSK